MFASYNNKMQNKQSQTKYLKTNYKLLPKSNSPNSHIFNHYPLNNLVYIQNPQQQSPTKKYIVPSVKLKHIDQNFNKKKIQQKVKNINDAKMKINVTNSINIQSYSSFQVFRQINSIYYQQKALTKIKQLQKKDNEIKKEQEQKKDEDEIQVEIKGSLKIAKYQKTNQRLDKIDEQSQTRNNIKIQDNFKNSLIQSFPQINRLKTFNNHSNHHHSQNINGKFLHSTLRKSLKQKIYKSHNFIGKNINKIQIEAQHKKLKSLSSSLNHQETQSSFPNISQSNSFLLMRQILKKSQKQVCQNIKRQSYKQKSTNIKTAQNQYKSILKKQKLYKLRKIKISNKGSEYEEQKQVTDKLLKKISIGAQQYEAKKVMEQFSQQFVRSDQVKNSNSMMECLKSGLNNKVKCQKLQNICFSQINAWQIDSTNRYEKYF